MDFSGLKSFKLMDINKFKRFSSYSWTEFVLGGIYSVEASFAGRYLNKKG